MKKVLLLVDCQNDFITGSLAVKDAKDAMDNLVKHIEKSDKVYDAIIITKDKHPANHCSFQINGGEWPEHCVENTVGQQLYAPLLNALSKVKTAHEPFYIEKGVTANKDYYSAFHYDLIHNRKDIIDYFYNSTCVEIVVAGLAGDYCVIETIKDIQQYYSHFNVSILDRCIASVEDGMGNKKLRNFMVHNYPKQIIRHFTDTDFYTFTCQYFALKNFPRSIVKYKFFDRAKTQYPDGFGQLIREQIEMIASVQITEEEIDYMKSQIDFLPDWYYTYLRGFRFNPNQVRINQDENGYLDITIEGPWNETIVWEMPILSTIAELKHYIDGHYMNNAELTAAREKAYNDCMDMRRAELNFADMGTRRRYSFDHQDMVLQYMKKAEDIIELCTGRFLGTSNVYFAMKYNLKPIGTMSHQCISLIEGLVSSPFEANHTMMKLWAETFNGNCGIYLYDCFGDKLFFDNLSLEMALLYDGLRQDSGDERDQTLKICAKYESLGINPRNKSVVYSNALNKEKAIELHNWIGGRVKDSYGIGTYFTGTVKDYKPMNIVIKAIEARITEKREPHDLVKLSCDKGKTLGNPDKCQYILSLIEKQQD